MGELGPGEHTLRLVNVTGCLSVDGFLIVDPYNRVDLKLKAGNGASAELYGGYSLGYELRLGDPSLNLEECEVRIHTIGGRHPWN